MEADTIKSISENPTFIKLVKERSTLALKLSFAILIVYYAFILTIAFSPETLGMAIGEGVTTVGIPVGMAIIVFSFLLTGIYIKRANTEFDKMTQKIKDDLRKDT